MFGLTLVKTKTFLQLSERNDYLRLQITELEETLRLKIIQTADQKQQVQNEQQRQTRNKLADAASAKHEATIQAKIGNYERGHSVRIKADGVIGVIRNIWWWKVSDKEPHVFHDEPRFLVRVPTKENVRRRGQRRTRSIEDLSRYDMIEFMSWEIELLDEVPSKV